MDASAPAGNISGVCSTEEPIFRIPLQQNSKVIKYTKLPQLEENLTNVPCHALRYPLHPRQRCIATLHDELSKTLKPIFTSRIMSSSFTKRKFVTISEDDENEFHPQFSKVIRNRRPTQQLVNSSGSTDFKVTKSNVIKSNKTTSRLSPSRNTRETPLSAESNIVSNKKNVNSKRTNIYRLNAPVDNSILQSSKQKDLDIDSKSRFPKTFISKSSVSRYESKTSKMKLPPKKNVNQKPKQCREFSILKNVMHNHPSPVNIIYVPIESRHDKVPRNDIIYNDEIIQTVLYKESTVDCTKIENNCSYSDVNTSIRTDPPPTQIDQGTDMNNFQYKSITELETNNNRSELTCNRFTKQPFDSLDIPNVTLTKDKTDSPKDEIVNVYSKSLPNLNVPPLKVTPSKVINNQIYPSFSKSPWYIIERATLTYTTEQKINFQVVGAKNDDRTLHLSNTSPLEYPLSVVSIFKKEVQNSEHDIITGKVLGESNDEYANCLNELKSLDCSFVFNSHKCVKPSDIISTLKVSSGFLANDNSICEQFQRELNFIDSFFESLQFLERCALAEKCLTDNKVENWISKSGCDVKNTEISSSLTKFENGALVDDVTNHDTMASKSLCLLNLLIRDEQRRAKNLLFVLKMREDALKDFTKSQILWLENKKKQDNTDISTLKKKQRGALLKLQHECGEMQRMRKALLALSEKRKVALMKTKKNIELKLTNNVNVDQILLGKKKLKRTQSSLDRQNLAPLKCFDLSSSGCEDAMTSRIKSDPTVDIIPSDLLIELSSVSSAEKCVQTSDSVLGSLLIDKSSDAANEDFVAVDGGYLNIIFHNLSLPQIFSSGKQYEVNEEALKNIVNSANSLNKFNESDVVDKLTEEMKNRDMERSTTPSTARSLVEELDQYYKGVSKEDMSYSGEDKSYSESDNEQVEHDPNNWGEVSGSTACFNGNTVSEIACLYGVKTKVIVSMQASPLPVQACTDDGEDQPIDLTIWNEQRSASSLPDVSEVCESPVSSIPSLTTISSTVQVEAEELRRQQVAIEREIKALEQQQCQLLVVREIPDKPPPPYTPPTEVRPKLPQMFQTDQLIETKICAFINGGMEADCEDPFDQFLKDFCDEEILKYLRLKSDKPWDSCNLLPQKTTVEDDELVKRMSADLCDVLAGVPTIAVSGVGSRRSDHIDDILFAEWRHCEPEWTALHIDEVVVKNQIFNSIFQKILSETIGEYKRNVLKIL